MNKRIPYQSEPDQIRLHRDHKIVKQEKRPEHLQVPSRGIRMEK